MKRTEMSRRTPLAATDSLKRTTAIKPVSNRAKVKGRQRRTLRKDFLKANPSCEACGRPAIDVHEIIRRSQAKDAELRQELFISLCRPCHTHFTDNPVFAHEAGFTLWSWEDSVDNLEIAARRRVQFAKGNGGFL